LEEEGRVWTEEALKEVALALDGFAGSRRRSEIIWEGAPGGGKPGLLFIDDYGHTPTQVRLTLEALREFYPGRRLVLSFMSHTASRTAALIDGFATAFDAADELYLHKIYASARDDKVALTGEDLYKAVLGRCRKGLSVHYYDDFMDALGELTEKLGPGDLFVTMGAGDNWKLGKALIAGLKP
jgi:UDP-N-acetylmuramate--alanine ligase